MLSTIITLQCEALSLPQKINFEVGHDSTGRVVMCSQEVTFGVTRSFAQLDARSLSVSAPPKTSTLGQARPHPTGGDVLPRGDFRCQKVECAVGGGLAVVVRDHLAIVPVGGHSKAQ